MERVANNIFLSLFYSSVQFAPMPKSVVSWPMVKREFQAQCVWVSTSIFQIHPACLPLNSPRKHPNDLITTQAFLSSLCQLMTWYSKIYINTTQQGFGGSEACYSSIFISVMVEQWAGFCLCLCCSLLCLGSQSFSWPGQTLKGSLELNDLTEIWPDHFIIL